MTKDDYDALSQKHLASIKRDMRVSLEDAAVRATHKVMAEEETSAQRMKEEWLFPGAVVPVDVETTAALVAEIKRLVDVVGGLVLAQPEQEPVAYYHPHKGFYWAKPTKIIAPVTADVKPLALYEQCTWVGLTDEERFEIRMHSIENMGENFQETLCKAIEAKLKEKNT